MQAPTPASGTAPRRRGPRPRHSREDVARAAVAIADPQRRAGQFARLPELLATGRYPRFAAAVAHGEPETFDPAAHFDRLLGKILDGLVRG